eukprot:GHVU01077256.1.p1 GENE.GHVU01077256.1~~GHVU01077256.1.p1  ORF type:complete len:609 (+),score=116.86 GHVU01077256.1:453-2279(+)
MGSCASKQLLGVPPSAASTTANQAATQPKSADADDSSAEPTLIKASATVQSISTDSTEASSDVPSLLRRRLSVSNIDGADGPKRTEVSGSGLGSTGDDGGEGNAQLELEGGGKSKEIHFDLNSTPPSSRSSSVDLKAGNLTCASTGAAPTPTLLPRRSRRISISGAMSKTLQTQFENKEVSLVDEESDDSTDSGCGCPTGPASRMGRHSSANMSTGCGSSALTATAVGQLRTHQQEKLLCGEGVGFVCKKGLKPESPNQDDFFIFRTPEWALYGVFDGHGPYGHEVSNFVQQFLGRKIPEHAAFLTSPCDALRQCFVDSHRALERTTRIDCTLSGTTATVVLHKYATSQLHVAHVGDSRCVLIKGREVFAIHQLAQVGTGQGRGVAGKTKGGAEGASSPASGGQRGGAGAAATKATRMSWDAVDVTEDHKPTNPAERKRILHTGGQVRRLEGDVPHRVFIRGKQYPGLAMSRAIGDSLGTRAGVIATPDTSTVDLDRDADVGLMLCSDGVWEFLDSRECATIAAPLVHQQQPRQAAEVLATEAWRRWIQEEATVVDDITAIVVDLKASVPPGRWSTRTGTAAGAPAISIAEGGQGGGGGGGGLQAAAT